MTDVWSPFSLSNREQCEDVIKKFHGQPVGQERLLLQVRYSDTNEQKRLKAETQKRRQYRANEYNAAAYGPQGPPSSSPRAFLAFRDMRLNGISTTPSAAQVRQPSRMPLESKPINLWYDHAKIA